MVAIRELPIPLVIVCLALIRGYSPLPAPSLDPTIPGRFTAEDSVLPTDDYDVDKTPIPILPVTVDPNEKPQKRCDYDPCDETQSSCQELSLSTGCRCPGFSLSTAPEAPKLQSVSWNGSEVVIRWCAPNSDVTGYVVKVGGQDIEMFGMHKRSGGVGVVDQIAKVCVVAVNDFGSSEPHTRSCSMYKPRDNSHRPVLAGLIGGALGLLLLSMLAVLLWRHKRQRK